MKTNFSLLGCFFSVDTLPLQLKLWFFNWRRQIRPYQCFHRDLSGWTCSWVMEYVLQRVATKVCLCRPLMLLHLQMIPCHFYSRLSQWRLPTLLSTRRMTIQWIKYWENPSTFKLKSWKSSTHWYSWHLITVGQLHPPTLRICPNGTFWSTGT